MRTYLKTNDNKIYYIIGEIQIDEVYICKNIDEKDKTLYHIKNDDIGIIDSNLSWIKTVNFN